MHSSRVSVNRHVMNADRQKNVRLSKPGVSQPCLGEPNRINVRLDLHPVEGQLLSRRDTDIRITSISDD
jgi:hypothetical protein